MVARLARFLGLPEKLAAAVRLQRRRRGGSAGQRLLALLYAACAGGGHLTAVDALGTDEVARQTCGLQAGPASRRLVPLGAQACGQRWGSVPVCVDGPGIEGEGQLCENAERGYHGEQQSWLHAVFVGVAWVSARLQAGGTDVQGMGGNSWTRMWRLCCQGGSRWGCGPPARTPARIW